MRGGTDSSTLLFHTSYCASSVACFPFGVTNIPRISELVAYQHGMHMHRNGVVYSSSLGSRNGTTSASATARLHEQHNGPVVDIGSKCRLG
jgi:hypothetical protein